MISRWAGWRRFLPSPTGKDNRRCRHPLLSIAANRPASRQRYFRRGWSERGHGGRRPGALFVFETPQSEAAFLDVSDGVEGLDVITANSEALGEHGILGEAWILPPPHSLDRALLAALY